MRIDIPRQNEPFLEGSNKPVNRSWFQWLRRMWWGSGYAAEVPIYSDLYEPGVSLGTDIADAYFDTGVLYELSCQFRLPNNYRPGTPLDFWFEWIPDMAVGGDVYWGMVVLTAITGETYGGGYLFLGTFPTNSEIIMQRVNIGDITDGTISLKKGHNIYCIIARLGGDPLDTHLDDVLLSGVGIKYQIDGAGWETMHP